MNYEKIYKDLISKCKNRKIDSNEYFESHHIIPRCIGGNNNPENIVNLYPKEHFIAHKLLCEIFKDNKSIKYAFCMMVFTTIKSIEKRNTSFVKRFYQVSSRDFNECRKFLGEQTSKRNKNTIYIYNKDTKKEKRIRKEDLRNYISLGWVKGSLKNGKSLKNKIYVNNKEKEIRIDKTQKSLFLENGWQIGRLEENRKKLIQHASHTFTKETLIKKSISVSGTKNPGYGKKIMNKDGIVKKIPLNEVENYINLGWKLGMLKQPNVKENTRFCQKNTISGRLYVHTEAAPFLIRYARQEEYEYYVNELKWLPGQGKHRNESKEYFKKYGAQKISVYKLSPYEKRIIPIELKDFYLENGWNLGQGNYFKDK